MTRRTVEFDDLNLKVDVSWDRCRGCSSLRNLLGRVCGGGDPDLSAWCYRGSGGCPETLIYTSGRWVGGDPRGGKWKAGKLVTRGAGEADCKMI